VAPAGVPTAVVNLLAIESARALADPNVQKSLAAQGAIATSSTPKELEDKTRFEIDKWSNVIKLAKIPRIAL
jgi:tripartite-type tricarboxylate transporter receptor subunit TctC